MEYKKLKIGIIGYGKVGSTLAKIWNENNLTINIYDRNIKNKSSENSINFFLSSKEVLENSDIIFLSVQEKYLKNLIINIKDKLNENQILVHLSGAIGLDIFNSISEYRKKTAIFHPFFSFPKKNFKADNLSKTIIGIVANKYIYKYLELLSNILKAEPILIDENMLNLYHASATILSGGIPNLIKTAISFLKTSGVSEETAKKTIIEFAQSIIGNIKEFGIEKATTGPWERKAIDIIYSHIKVIDKYFPHKKDLYIELAKEKIPQIRSLEQSTDILTDNKEN